ncbi:MAG: HNH endonuclease [Eggerthellaceae bacterium]
MSVSCESLSRTLQEVFETSFICEKATEEQYCFSVRPALLDPGSGFAVKTNHPYRDACSASVQFGNFSRQLIASWFESEENIKAAFKFSDDVSSDVVRSISVAGKRILSPEGFLAEKSSDWAGRGIYVKFSAREFNPEDIDYHFYLVTIAALGFALFASGMAQERQSEGDLEGEACIAEITRYERSPLNRAKCLAYHGTRCAVCGFDFGEFYGDFASGFIEVHHINPLSQVNGPVKIDPINDLIPLCPNCHAAVHMANPPLNPQDLKQMIESGKKTQ